jgi:serine/threonine protein kinase
MAPELLEGKTDISERTDVYAFGILVYEVRACNDISVGNVVHRRSRSSSELFRSPTVHPPQ